jgi:hypothetical protein
LEVVNDDRTKKLTQSGLDESANLERHYYVVHFLKKKNIARGRTW